MMGIYGLVAFTVAQRTREIGIRKAVGATTSDIVRLVTFGQRRAGRRSDSSSASALGTLGAVALGGFIVGVSPIDPLTIAVTTVLVVGTTLAASALPALRAARVDPLRGAEDGVGGQGSGRRSGASGRDLRVRQIRRSLLEP